MAANRPVVGRPARPEGIKCLILGEFTFNLWNERKEALEIHWITNSEFAEMLLYENFGAHHRTNATELLDGQKQQDKVSSLTLVNTSSFHAKVSKGRIYQSIFTCV